ncbi:uncharacterized protein LOC106448752 [Brassica napus]|nr:uncharacterized protein LOC106448752 [Brassica napus]
MDDYGAQLEVGMMFRNRDSFKQHIAMFAIAKKFCYCSAKSDPSMMILKCISSTCPWRVYATKLKDSEVFEVRKLAIVHTCSIAERGGYQGQATSVVIGELMKAKFAGNGIGPRPREIRMMMHGDHDVSISYWKAWKSRDMAVDNGHGTCNASYIKLPSYLNNLVLANLGSLANLHTDQTEEGGHRFKYMFLALGASIEGYKGMRKVVVVDGTHLKGRYAGSFVPNEPGLVVVSDRHPSIYKGISKVYPSSGHCICVLHLKRNIRSNFCGRHLEYLVAKAARAYKLRDFYVTFNEIKAMDPKCASYLIEIGFEHWARSNFPGNRYNVMTSNLAESWNFVLSKAREFPIVQLIDFIRGKLMTWFAKRRDSASKSGGVLTPRIEGILTNNFEMTGGYEVVDIAEKEYEIRNKTGGSFHVNLRTRTCSCFEFQMLAIPCSYAIAAALKAKINVEELVIDEYKLDSLNRAYEGIILPESASPVGVGMSSIVSDLQLGPPAT